MLQVSSCMLAGYEARMATFNRFEDIEAWQLARRLTASIYTITRENAFARDFALREQLRRDSNPITSNLAQRHESRARGIFLALLGRAHDLSGEARCQLYVAVDAGYISQA